MARRTPRADITRLLSYRLTMVAALLSRAQLARFGDVADISLAEWRTLVLVGTFGPLTVKELAKRAGLDLGQTSRLVTRMADAGLIAKARADDARSVILSLTAQGQSLRRELWAVAMRCNDDFLRGLPEPDRRGLLKALDLLAAAAKASLSKGRSKRG